MTDFLLALILAASAAVAPEIPEGYYDSLDGRSGAALAEALRSLAETRSQVRYGTASWSVFELTDVIDINGRQAWRDIYSNNIVWLPDHASLNIEHALPKSWWGGEEGSAVAYCDLFNLSPSDQLANARKSNYPPAELADSRVLDNGLLRVGTPRPGMGGAASTAFEPADEYKGDFARTYFYMVTAFPSVPWRDDCAYLVDTSGKLLSWAREMLMVWHHADPVDSREIDRNNTVAAAQGNRNPFIDHPELADHIWGNLASVPFKVKDNAPAMPTERPQAPRFDNARVTGVNTYSARWWNATEIPVRADGCTTYASVDGSPFAPAEVVKIPAAAGVADSHLIEAYAVFNDATDATFRSPVARLTLHASDPANPDYSAARWQPTDETESPDGNRYVILAAPTLRIMGADGGNSASAFMPCSGYVDFDSELVVDIPADAATVRFEKLPSGAYRLAVDDTRGNVAGYWNATAKNKMRLDPATYTSVTPKFNADGTCTLTFERFGTLQYNAQQPRFLNYESNQKPVRLYRLKDMAGAAPLPLPDPEDAPEEGPRILLDLSGRRISGADLAPGIYIEVTPKGSRKILLR